MKIFIAAPFGNYLKFKKRPNVIAVTGTWTRDYRGGYIYRLWKIAKTMRYNRTKQGWVNKLGLPNPGIAVGLKKTKKQDILSIAAIHNDDFKKLYDIIPKNQSLEINFSCPNLDDKSPPSWADTSLFTNNESDRSFCIAKISPETSEDQLAYLIDDLGFKQIHCSNTLPVNAGGLSGRTLIPYVEKLIQTIRTNWGHNIEIIAGGGISEARDIKNYLKKGSDHISLGTVCFTPWKLNGLINSSKV